MTMDKPDSSRQYADWHGAVRSTMAASQPWWPDRPKARAGSPNVVVVLVDDLGFSDIGCFGSEIPTPHLDQTAAEGVRMGNFRVTPLCSPTRAALMTGLNAHAAGIGFPTQIDPGFPGYTSELPPDQPTLPEVFRFNGYSTLMVGKWHLCKERDFNEAGSRHSWPLQRGFDQFYGFLDGLTNSHHPHRLYEGNSVVHVDDYPDDYYLTDDLTDRALRMIRENHAADPAKPFFMYFAHAAVHAPMHARADDIARHSGLYGEGWDAIRERRLAKQIELGVMPAGTTLPPRNWEPGLSVDAWDSLNSTEQRVYARHMEVYAAMVGAIDRSVGRIRELLAEIGELENTIICFSSDNGAARLADVPRPAPSWASVKDTGTAAYVGHYSEPLELRAIDERLPDNLDTLGGPTTWPCYPRGWAMASNTPFRLYKFSPLRGGQQSPFIISWPRGLESGAGEVRHQYAHVTDVFPTMVDLLGLDVPTGHPGNAAPRLDGTSFKQVLIDADEPSAHLYQYTECAGSRAYYSEGWEAVSTRQSGVSFSEEKWELFAPGDLIQANDVADLYPEKLAELQKAFDHDAWENQVYPLDEGSGVKFLQHPPPAPLEAVRILAGTPTLERHRSSLLIQGDHCSIAVDWDYRPGDEGVLFAHGDQAGGYQLRVESDSLWLEQNQFGTLRTFGPISLDGPSSSVELLLDAAGAALTATLLVDGVERTVVRDWIRFKGHVPFEGIDVGICRRSPVSWELYQRRRTAPFSGRLHSVTYRPDPDTGIQTGRRLESAREIGLAMQ